MDVKSRSCWAMISLLAMLALASGCYTNDSDCYQAGLEKGREVGYSNGKTDGYQAALEALNPELQGSHFSTEYVLAGGIFGMVSFIILLIAIGMSIGTGQPNDWLIAQRTISAVGGILGAVLLMPLIPWEDLGQTKNYKLLGILLSWLTPIVAVGSAGAPFALSISNPPKKSKDQWLYSLALGALAVPICYLLFQYNRLVVLPGGPNCLWTILVASGMAWFAVVIFYLTERHKVIQARTPRSTNP